MESILKVVIMRTIEENPCYQYGFESICDPLSAKLASLTFPYNKDRG